MKKQLTEAEVHHVWHHQNVSPQQFKTEKGEEIIVIEKGEFNENSGPDFLEAILIIGGVTWCGHVEIHLKASDWFRHGHQYDPAYNNVILHVVCEDDVRVKDIPVMKINLTSHQLDKKHKPQKVDIRKLPCHNFFQVIPDLLLNQWKKNSLSLKLRPIFESVNHSYDNSLQELFYNKVARYFGLYVNQQAFEYLVASIPFKIIQRIKFQPELVEALLFGQAGFLEESPQDEYQQILTNHFKHLKRKYDLTPISKVNWKFSRMRPASFPTIRISQFSKFLCAFDFEAIEDAIEDYDLWNQKLKNVTASDYWFCHSKFGAPSRHQVKNVGESLTQRIYINILPYMFAMMIDDFKDYINKISELYKDIPAENNNVVKSFLDNGLKINNAFDSQSVLGCYKYNCRNKNCKNCEVGQFILTPQSGVLTLH